MQREQAARNALYALHAVSLALAVLLGFVVYLLLDGAWCFLVGMTRAEAHFWPLLLFMPAWLVVCGAILRKTGASVSPNDVRALFGLIAWIVVLVSADLIEQVQVSWRPLSDTPCGTLSLLGVAFASYCLYCVPSEAFISRLFPDRATGQQKSLVKHLAAALAIMLFVAVWNIAFDALAAPWQVLDSFGAVLMAVPTYRLLVARSAGGRPAREES